MAVITLAGYRPSPRYDGRSWTDARLEGGSSQTGPWSMLEEFELTPADTDPTAPLERNFTTEQVTSETWVRLVFIDATGDEETTLPVALIPTTLATSRDVAARLGRDLTDDEQGQVDFLLDAATAEILAAVGKDLAWLMDTETTVPPLFRFICADVVCRGLSISPGVAVTREQLGAYAYTQTATSTPGCLLTVEEEATLRRLIWGSNTGSVRIPSIANDLYGPYEALNGGG